MEQETHLNSHKENLGKFQQIKALKTLDQKNHWNKFFSKLLLIGSSGFLISGVLFFFAFNWGYLTNFFKFGILIFLIAIGVYLSTFTKLAKVYQDIGLLSSSILVGILFVVFSQVYQTKADDYKLFLFWFIAITPWTLVSKFSFQWLVYFVLLNTWSIFWLDSSFSPSENTLYLGPIMIGVNLVVFLVLLLQSRLLLYRVKKYLWLIFYSLLCYYSLYVLAVIISDYFEFDPLYLGIGLFGVVTMIALHIVSVKQKNVLHYSIVLFSWLILGFMILLRCFDFYLVSYLIYTLYWVITGWFMVKMVNNSLKKWQNE